MGLNAFQVGWQAFNLLSGRWRVRRRAQQLVTKGLGLIPLAILLGPPKHRYLEPNPAGTGGLPAGLDLDVINHGIFTALLVVALIVGIQFVWELWKSRKPLAEAIGAAL